MSGVRSSTTTESPAFAAAAAPVSAPPPEPTTTTSYTAGSVTTRPSQVEMVLATSGGDRPAERTRGGQQDEDTRDGPGLPRRRRLVEHDTGTGHQRQRDRGVPGDPAVA